MGKINTSKDFMGAIPHQESRPDNKWSWATSITFVVLLSLAGWTGVALLFL